TGLRNPWRFHIDSATGIPYIGDVGQDVYEEVDEVYPGSNFGWPFREAFSVRTWGECDEPGGSGHTSYDGPIASLNHNEDYHAILTAGVYRRRGQPTDWPAGYDGTLFYCDYYNGFMRRMTKKTGTW